MNIADQLFQISIFLAQDRFETVLKQMPTAAMPAIIADGISGKHPLHDSRYWCISGFEEKMYMIGNQSPCVAKRSGLQYDRPKPFEKIVPVMVIAKYHPAFDPSSNDVVQCTGCINSGFPWHAI